MKKHHFALTSDAAIHDLRQRLERRRSVTVPSSGHSGSVNEQLLDDLLTYWAQGYDWRQHERRIASWNWVETESTAHPLRLILETGRTAGAPVVVLLHGWPDSVLRFEKVLPLLADLTVVVPALPGFPFAAAVEGGGMSSVEMADLVAEAMAELGYDRYVVSAGDVGCDVAEALAARHPEVVASLHLTDLSQLHFLSDLPDDLDETEDAYVRRGYSWQAREGAYMHEQSTRPGTLAVGLGDSPAGLTAWLLEKLVSWSDSEGDLGTVFTDDDALTWIAAYWYSGAIGTSFAPYAMPAPKDWSRIEAPTVMTMFPADLVNAPQRFVQRFFAVVDWMEFPRGGHFAAWEQSKDYVAGIRRALAAAV